MFLRMVNEANMHWNRNRKNCKNLWCVDRDDDVCQVKITKTDSDTSINRPFRWWMFINLSWSYDRDTVMTQCYYNEFLHFTCIVCKCQQIELPT